MPCADPRSAYRRQKCRDQDYAFTLDNSDVWVRFLESAPAAPEGEVAHLAEAQVFRIVRYVPKKERAAGHLSELLEEETGFDSS